MKRICTLALGLGILGSATSAKAVNVDFEGFQTGAIVEFAGFGSGIFSVSAQTNNPMGMDVATVVNTEQAGSDKELKYKYSSGNLRNSRLRKVLVVARDGTDANGNGILDNPDDGKQGGSLTLQFFNPIKSFGFDVLDVDATDAPQTTVEFRFEGAPLAVIPFTEFTRRNSPYNKRNVQWGNNSANRIMPITSNQLGGSFDEVVFTFPSAMGFDNLNYRVDNNVIPEPTALGLLLGLPALASLRRRRKA
jgi:hypothetical protein